MKKTNGGVGIGMSKQEKTARRWFISLAFGKIVVELFILLYITGMFWEIFWVPVLGSLGASLYGLFIAFRHRVLTPAAQPMVCRVFHYGSALTVLILGCMLLYGGNFGAGHAPVFFTISVLIFGLTLIQSTLRSSSFHKNQTQRYPKKQALMTLVIGGLLFTSSILFTNYKINVDNPPRYTQEDLDGAIIAYVDVEINATLAPEEITVYKTWHAGESYLTSLFILTSTNCNVYCSYISDKQLTGGSVSIGDGRTTIEMTDNEGWVYFVVGWSQSDEELGLDPEESEWRTDLPANYTFTITSNHLNYQYPV
jgi:hypothetical protein